MICQCGHSEEAHSHYRRGTDCGTCGRDRCSAFKPSKGPASTKEAVVVEQADQHPETAVEPAGAPAVTSAAVD